MKPNKQKTEWEKEFDEQFDKMTFTTVDIKGKEVDRPKIKAFISQLLSTQRQQLISEIEGIVGEDEVSDDGTIELAEEIVIINDNNVTKEDVLNSLEEQIKIRNQLRKEIRERLKQIKSLEEKK